MTCRCPACDQVLIVDDHITASTVICCDRCDRGFAPRNALCTTCSVPNPFVRYDATRFRCDNCGTMQPDVTLARMSA